MTSRKVDREIFAWKFVEKKEEVLANQVFIEESILSEAKFINSNIKSKNKELIVSNFLKSKKLKMKSSNQVVISYKTGWLEIYSSNYIKEKLIKILDD